MHRYRLPILALLLPAALAAQSAASHEQPKAVILPFIRFADLFGGRLVAAFDSIPASQYGFRPTSKQQTVGYIAQHLEGANYGLCERLGKVTHHRTSKDSLADTIKATWPKDTLVARLDASLHFCASALEQLDELNSATLANILLAFETDLAEHYSQIATYMRILGLIPPSALPLKQRTAIDLPSSSLLPYVGSYALFQGAELVVTLVDGALTLRSSPGGSPIRLWAESGAAFFVKDQDVQVTFTRDMSGQVTGLVFRQFGRARSATKMR